MIEQFYFTDVKDSVDQGLMAIKGYSTFPKVPGFEPHHQIQF